MNTKDMNQTEGGRVDVELCGGPLDGHVTEVALKGPEFDVWLFRYCHCEGLPTVLAYAWAGRSVAGGKRWVLNFLYEAAKMGVRKEGGAR
jgi:hypothetical protein